MSYRFFLLIVFLLPGILSAAESKPIPLKNTPGQFQLLITDLRSAAKSKNAVAVYKKLASDYYIQRDFGGTYNPKASAKVNFSWTFQLDNSQLRPEYKDHGWKAFRARISSKQFERKKNGQLCMPHGAMDKKPFPHGQLCFKKTKDERWWIAGHINGGD